METGARISHTADSKLGILLGSSSYGPECAVIIVLTSIGTIIIAFLFGVKIPGTWLLGTLGGIAVLTLLLYRWVEASFQTLVYEYGIVKKSPLRYVNLDMSDVVRYFYRAVTTYVNFANTGTRHYLTIVGKEGEKIRLSAHSSQAGAKRIITPEVVLSIVDALTQAWINPALEAYNRGENLDFGPVQLSRYALSIKRLFAVCYIGSTRIPINEIRSYSVQNGSLHIYSQKGLLSSMVPVSSIPISAVPNYLVLLQMLEIIQKNG